MYFFRKNIDWIKLILYRYGKARGEFLKLQMYCLLEGWFEKYIWLHYTFEQIHSNTVGHLNTDLGVLYIFGHIFWDQLLKTRQNWAICAYTGYILIWCAFSLPWTLLYKRRARVLASSLWFCSGPGAFQNQTTTNSTVQAGGQVLQRFTARAWLMNILYP